MKTADRRILARLPVSEAPWEVALLPPPPGNDPLPYDGLLVVVDQTPGGIRAFEAVKVSRLGHAMLEAAVRPLDELPAQRPCGIRCAEAGLTERLAGVFAGTHVPVEQVESVPMIDSLVAALEALTLPPQAPGISVDCGRWAATLESFGRLAPWRSLGTDVIFRFRGDIPELHHAVGLVVGRNAPQHGIVVYPSDEIRALVGSLAPGSRDPEEVDGLCLYVGGADCMTPRDIAACRAAGLALEGGLFPRFFAIRAGRPFHPTEREQAVQLAALEAISGACGANAADLAFSARSSTVSTHLGDLVVSSAPGARPARPAPPRVRRGARSGALARAIRAGSDPRGGYLS